MKRYKFIFAIIVMCLFFACKHNDGKKIDVEEGDPSLSLVEMYVHFQKVENESVSISWSEVNSFDIIAKFNYGSVKLEEIPVVMESSPIILTKDETILLTCPAVSGKYKEWKGKVSIKKIDAIPQDKDVIDSFVVSGRRDKGVYLNASDEVYREVKNGGYPTIEMKGDILQFLVGHSKKVWSSVRLNGNDIPVATRAKLFICESGCAVDYDISGLNSLVPVLIEANLNGKKAYVHFKIKHVEGTCDIPELTLYVNNKKVSIFNGEKNMLEEMSKGTWPMFDGTETSKCVVEWESDYVAECKINGDLQEIKTEKDGDEDVWFVEYNATDCTTEGKDITVNLKSKNPKLFHDVKWEFKIKKI